MSEFDRIATCDVELGVRVDRVASSLERRRKNDGGCFPFTGFLVPALLAAAAL